jgi:hypothetical protein
VGAALVLNRDRDALTVFQHGNLGGSSDQCMDLTLSNGPLPHGFPAALLLAPLFCFQTSLFGSDRFMRDDAD